MRRFLDALTLGLARVLTHVFYRLVEVQGAGAIPAAGPVIFVANHANSLVDPLLLIARLPRRVRFLAKSTLWRNPLVMPLLALAGAIPVVRRQDGGDMARNQEAFARCHERLAAGGAIALFPEGISHDEPALQPLKTGAARIALGAERSCGGEVPIVPVGLTFEEKGRFRSRLLIVVGEPILPSQASPPEAEPEETRVRRLTERIDAGLRSVTLNFPSREVGTLVERAVEVYAEDERALPGQPDLARRFSLRRAFGEGYAMAREKHPERIEQIERMAHHYDGMLRALGLRDDQVTARYPLRHAMQYVTDRLPVLLLGLPVAAVGTLLGYLPYRLPGWVAWWVRRHGDLPATYKILTGLVAAPLWWAFEAWVAAALFGTVAGVAVGLAAPLTGYLALRFHERNGSLWREVLAYLTLRLRPAQAVALRTLRAEIRREISALVADLQGEGALAAPRAKA